MNEFQSYVEMLCSQKADFYVLLSRNSQIIKTPEGKKIMFTDKKMNPRIFHIVRELKKESEDFLNSNKLFTTMEERGGIRYYNYSKDLPDKLNEFYYVDISAAYITSLLNHNIISEYMFDKINSLDKKDRLIVLGMLAYEPYILTYENGERKFTINENGEKIIEPPIRQYNRYAPVFYLACQYIQVLMEKITEAIKEKRPYFYRDSSNLKSNYLFYWVDGIFFQDPACIEKITKILDEEKYFYKSGKCKKWELISEENFLSISFLQGKGNDFEKKAYNIPHYFQNYRDNIEFTELINKGNYSELFIKLADKKYGEIK